VYLHPNRPPSLTVSRLLRAPVNIREQHSELLIVDASDTQFRIGACMNYQCVRRNCHFKLHNHWQGTFFMYGGILGTTFMALLFSRTLFLQEIRFS